MVKPSSSNPRQQASSSEIASEPAHSSSDKKYRGVRKRKWGKYVSEIRLPNCRERIWLGSYDTADKAARAFDAALYCLRGPGARFNFPDDPPHIENGSSMNPSEIQAAAARFAQSRGGGAPLEVADSGSDTLSETSDVSRREMPLDTGFLDHFRTAGNNEADMGLFPEFNEYMGTGDYYFLPPLPDDNNNNNNNNTWQETNNNFYDYGEQNTGGSFLWNF